MDDLAALHAAALTAFDQRVAAVPPERWGAPTPCERWTVTDLVRHNAEENLWVPPLLAGATVEDADVPLDLLDVDLVAGWAESRNRAVDAVAERGTAGTVHLSSGTAPATHYLRQRTIDLAVHAWDLARAIGVDDHLPADLCRACLGWVRAEADELAASALFADPVPVPEGAGAQAQLLGLLGRDPHAPLG